MQRQAQIWCVNLAVYIPPSDGLSWLFLGGANQAVPNAVTQITQIYSVWFDAGRLVDQKEEEGRRESVR